MIGQPTFMYIYCFKKIGNNVEETLEAETAFKIL